LIDDRGEAWTAGSSKLSVALGTRLDGRELERFVMSQMGYVTVRERDAVVEVTFEQATVSPRAIIGLLYKLAGIRGKPVALRGCSDQVGVKIIHDRGRAIAHLSEIVEIRRGGPRYAKQYAELTRTSFASNWEIAQDILASEMASESRRRVLEKLFAGAFTINQLDESDGQYRVLDWGSKVAAIDPVFSAHGAGLSYYDLSDRDYGRWIADTFKEYAGAQERRVEAVTARMSAPGLELRQYTYNRLVLPVERDGSRLLFVATDMLAG
jgi:predicted transcriptional regulator of viral defense system